MLGGVQGDNKFASNFKTEGLKSNANGLVQQQISIMIAISQGTAKFSNLFTVCDCDILA